MQLIVYAGLYLTGWLTVAGADQPPPANEPALDQLVTAFFSSDLPERRAELVLAIRARSGDDWSAVARALAQDLADLSPLLAVQRESPEEASAYQQRTE